MEGVHRRLEERIVLLTIENPPVNALSAAVQDSLRETVAWAVEEPAVDAIVLIGAGSTFAAGADIRQLKRMAKEGVVSSKLPQLLMEIEACGKPVVAAIQGAALGGGLELALTAHYRIATRTAKLGQPEVKLGIIPGAGGTQRLPRLAGVEAALEMCVFGEPVTGENAKRLDIVDRIAEDDLLEAAVRFAADVVRLGPRRARDLDEKLGTRESGLFAAYRERVQKTRRNQLAPEAAIEAIEAATYLPFEEGCLRERELFTKLLGSSQARALIHVFFAERAAGKVPGVDKSSPVLPIRTAAVVGAGTMGRGIAMCFANAGVPVVLKDTKHATLGAAVTSIAAVYEASVRKGKIAPDEMKTLLSRIRAQTDDAGFDDADIVVEAAFEDLDVKKAVFAELAEVAKADAILATNTSYLNVDEIAQACSRPEHVIGLHFFSPANVMRLLEVVPGRATRGIVTATAFGLARRLGKLAVLAGNCPGFIGNRMLRVYRREAIVLLEEGASPRQVDSALEEWGMAMGPFAAQDLAGIDIAVKSRQVFGVMEALYTRGRLGQKTGAGWYRYDASRRAIPDPEVEALIERAAREKGIARRAIAAEEIVERTIFALIDEGARILEEGYALRASDIDLVFINGYGFPSYRGGPMHYADELGVRRVRDRIHEFQATHGAHWEPAPLLERLADDNSSFGE